MSLSILEIDVDPGTSPSTRLELERQHGQYIITLRDGDQFTFIRISAEQASRLDDALCAALMDVANA